MPTQLRASFLRPLPLVALALASVAHAQSQVPAASATPVNTAALASPSLSIQSPTSGETVRGVTIIRFRSENVRIMARFATGDEERGQLPIAHLHVSVDGAAWHWVHASSDPIVITPLPAGEHTVTLDLAGADHRALDSRTVRFTIVGSDATSAIDHATHVLAMSADTAAVQLPLTPVSRWAIRVPSGALVSTGAQRNVLKDAALTAVQLSYAVHPLVAVTATLGWARSRDIATVGNPKLDVFTYDAGIEARAPQRFAGKAVTLSPFAGAGVGARSYNYRALELDATHNVAAYATVGGEAGVGRVRVRLEVRDYVAGFKPLNGIGASSTHNDIIAMFGIGFARHAAVRVR